MERAALQKMIDGDEFGLLVGESYTPQNGYEVDIRGTLNSDRVTADIKYACGELVYGWETFSFVQAGILVNNWLLNNPGRAYHEGCTDEYCIEVHG